MGIYDRDYERGYDTGSGWRDSYARPGGVGSWSVNAKLLLVLVVVYVIQAVLEEANQPWFTDALVLRSDWYTQPWRVYGLITYGFLHSPSDFFHLLFNGLVLFFFGRSIEARLGPREYFLYFLAAVLVAGVTWSIVEAFTPGPPAVLLGASGAVSAVVVLFAIYYPNSQVYVMGVLPIPAWLMATLAILGDIMGMTGARDSNVAFSAHLGGALFAFLYFRNAWRLTRWLPSEDRLSGWASAFSLKRRPKLKIHRDEDEDTEDPLDSRVDAILKKINEQGQDSLTREEQRLLQRASKQYQQKKR